MTTPGPTPLRSTDAVVGLLAALGADLDDDGYRKAAERRRADHRSSSSPWLLALGLLLVGLLLATAAVVTRARAPVVAQARGSLLAEIERRTSSADEAAATVTALSQELARIRTAALTSQSSKGTRAALERLDVLTGAVPVTGPGVRLVLDDAARSSGAGTPDDRVGAGASDAGRVLDRDVQIVVNGLFRAGAEAVAVNGQRLTSLSAIRSAGSAILVGYRPLSPPYTIEGVGSAERVLTDFTDGPGGRYLRSLADNYGVRSKSTKISSLTLPGSSGIALYYAAPSRSGTASSPSDDAPDRRSAPSAVPQ